MSDGARTRDILDHNQVLYLLSYTHHRPGKRASEKCTPNPLPREPVPDYCNADAAALAASESGPGWATRMVAR